MTRETAPKRASSPARKNTALITALLAQQHYFKGLDSANLGRVAALAARREYAAGAVLFSEGSACAGLHVVESGWLKVIRLSPSGREQVLRFFGPGESFNDVCAFVDVVEPATAIALEPSVVWVLPRDTMLGLLDQNPALSRAIIQVLSQRIVQLVNLVEDLSLHGVEARLARFLLDHSDTSVLAGRRTTQADIAARVGTVPDVLNRVLRTFAEEGLVEVERQRIRVRDRKGLRAKARLAES